MAMDTERLLQRFLRYVQIDTTAREGSPTYPSSPGQLELGRLLVKELRAMGLTDAEQDDHGIVVATVPATVSHAAPVVALNSHLDTSPETTGRNVRPQVLRNYQGGDITLPGNPDLKIRADRTPELQTVLGKTLITTDGTTLLGGDDKAGVAVIMETANYLAEHPELKHGPIKVVFTCDEEIGHGVDHVDLKKLGATVAYTLDGAGCGDIDVETFSADLATVVVRGVNIHPSIGKGRMVNAVRAAASFVDRLPRDRLSPETTEDREGFLHPYHISGGVAEVTMRIILRDFDTDQLPNHADLLRQAAAATMADFPGATIDVTVNQQYRNMADGLRAEPRAVAKAEEAFRQLGLPCQRTIVRGGTDGSRFTELGLPTPNLSTGQHSVHSPLEWACLEEMEQAANVLVELVQIWGEEN